MSNPFTTVVEKSQNKKAPTNRYKAALGRLFVFCGLHYPWATVRHGAYSEVKVCFGLFAQEMLLSDMSAPPQLQ